MEAFLVAARVVVPMALFMAIGVAVRRAGYVTRPAMRQVDTLTFHTFAPATVFRNIYGAELSGSIDGRSVLFLLFCIGILFVLAVAVPRRFVKDPRQCTALGQAILRSNYVVFSMAVAEAIYGKGNTAFVAIMSAVIIPATNLLSVILLTRGLGGEHSFAKTLRSVIRNPIILAALTGLAIKLLGIRFPDLLSTALNGLADVATTLCFISLGVGMDFQALHTYRRPLILGNLCRLVIAPLLFLPLAILLGFRGQTLCMLMVVFCAPTSVSTYPMAVAMGADGQLAGQMVFTTTVLSIFTIFFTTFTLSLFQLL